MFNNHTNITLLLATVCPVRANFYLEFIPQFSSHFYNFYIMYVLVEWTLESTVSIIKHKTITPPTDFNDVQEGAAVMAKWQGKVYPANVLKKSGWYFYIFRTSRSQE